MANSQDGELRRARDKVKFWEEDIKSKKKRASGWLATAADKEDYQFALGRLHSAQAELRRLEQT